MKCSHRYIILSIFLTVLLNANSGAAETFAETQSGWRKVRVFNGSDTPSGAFQDAVAIDLDSEGHLFIVDRGQNRLIKYDQNGGYIKEIGGYGSGTEQFSTPTDVCARLTLNVFVADYNNDRIVRFDSNLNYLNEFETPYQGENSFEMPLSVVVSGQYDLFILEDLNKRVLKFDRFNQPLASFGDASENLGQLLNPMQLAISDDGKVFVSDRGAEAIVVFDYLGNFLQEVRHPKLTHPHGIYVSSLNQLLVADPENHSVFFFREGRKFVESLDLSSQDLTPVDAALWDGKGKLLPRLYILTAKSCAVFEKKTSKK